MIKFKSREIPETLNEIIEPEHSVLMIYDMQTYLCTPESGATYTLGDYDQAQAIRNILNLRDVARRAGVRIWYTLYTDFPDYQSISDAMLHADLVTESLKQPKTQHNIYGSAAWEITPELTPAPGELSILKYRIDTFIGSNFDNLLRTNGIKTIVETGRSLDIGIDATARTAMALDYFVVVPSDCVMGRNKEYMAETMRWLNRSVIVTDMNRLIQSWEVSGH
jgi:nicotinamidase-related amidase